MRRFSLLFLLCAVSLCQAAPARLWVVAVGAARYAGGAAYARAAQRVAEAVADTAAPEAVTIYLLREDARDGETAATRANLLHVLDAVDRRASKTDRLLVYLCGQMTTPDTGADRRDYLLFPDDGAAAKDAPKEPCALALEDLRERLRHAVCAERLLWVDAVPRAYPANEPLSLPPAAIASAARGDNLHRKASGSVALLTAARPGEHGEDGLPAGVLSRALSAGLAGHARDADNRVTMAALAAYAQAHVGDAAGNVPAPHPVYDGAGREIVFRDSPERLVCLAMGGAYARAMTTAIQHQLLASGEVNVVKSLTLEEARALLKSATVNLADRKTARKFAARVPARYALCVEADDVPEKKVQVACSLVDLATGRLAPGITARTVADPAQVGWESASGAIAATLVAALAKANLTTIRGEDPAALVARGGHPYATIVPAWGGPTATPPARQEARVTLRALTVEQAVTALRDAMSPVTTGAEDAQSLTLAGAPDEVIQATALLAKLDAQATAHAQTRPLVAAAADLAAAARQAYPLLTVAVNPAGVILLDGARIKVDDALALIKRLDVAPTPPPAAPTVVSGILLVQG